MNPITRFSAPLYLGAFKFRMPLSPATTSRLQADDSVELIADFRVQTISRPIPENPSKSSETRNEVWGLGLVVLLVLGVGTAWACIVVRLAVMAAELEPLLVRNILWTHQ